MPKPDNIPTLSRLALQYGTISQDQYKQIVTLQPGDDLEKEAELLVKQGLATRHQIGLLRLIREYQVIRHQGESFGKIAVEKGFASEEDIQKALDVQKKAFRESRLKKLLGDILVDAKVISSDQKIIILKEQSLIEKMSVPSASQDTMPSAPDQDPDVELSTYEKKFLKIKALDEDFTAALMEKGLAGEEEIQIARTLQDDAFENENTIKRLGDIMVDLKMISQDQREIIFREQGQAPDQDEEPAIHVKIRGDKMAAWVHLNKKKPPEGVSGVKSAISTAGITEGVYPNAVLQCGLDSGMAAFPVARKDYSTELRDAEKLASHLDTGLSDKGEKKRGDLLAERQPVAVLGPCRNILGEMADRPSDLDFTLRCGSGSRLSKDGTKILAAKTGQPMLSVERQLYVHPTIHVLEDVDQRYGQIEPYANLNVSGTITGAYPITAGYVKATEIRGGRIEAIGSIHTEVGITDAVIRTQGDVHARYIHNCRIEIFGDLFVKNEIFDSDIRCAGKIDSPDCRVVASRLFAKQGITLGGTGSEKTLACEIYAGTEHHLFLQIERLIAEVDRVQSLQNRLTEKMDEKKQRARRTFEKMVELKVFHDRAKRTRQMLVREFKTKGRIYTPEKKKHLHGLVANYEGRQKKAVQSLKELNRLKKQYDKAGEVLFDKIERLIPKIHIQIKDFERTLFAYMEWARLQPGTPRIEIRGKAFQGSVFKGVSSELILESDGENLIMEERNSTPGTQKMIIL